MSGTSGNDGRIADDSYSRSILNRLYTWCGDSLRVLRAAAVWNARKAAYRRHGGVCPCHDPRDLVSQDDKRCLPAMELRRPTRFRHVCPLLKQAAGEWRCSVDASEVRPFWFRAVATYALCGVVLYLGGVSVAVQLLRRNGFPGLEYKEVVWPGHWRRIAWVEFSSAREEGMQAMRVGEYWRAQWYFKVASGLFRDDYQTNLMLAQLASIEGQDGASDTAFANLLRKYPEQAETTARTYREQLLARQRFDLLADLSGQRLSAGPEQSEGWESSLRFAVQHGRLAEKYIAAHPVEIIRLAPRVAVSLQVCALWQAGQVEAAATVLGAYRADGGDTQFMRWQIETLGQLGHPDEAAGLLNQYAGSFGDAFEHAALQYAINASRGRGQLLQSDAMLLLHVAISTAQVDRLCALFLRAGDRDGLRRLRAVFGTPAFANDARAHLALWVAALVAEDRDTLDLAARGVTRLTGRVLPRIQKFDFASTAAGDPAAPRSLLAPGTLLEETALALVAESIARRAKPGTAQPSGEN